MSEPVDRFCDAISELPQDEQSEIIGACCINLDRDIRVSLIFAATLETLRNRLNEIVKFGIPERFLIHALFSWLIDHFNYLIDPESVSESIDAHLDKIDELERRLKSTNSKSEKDVLRDLIEKLKEILAEKHQRKVVAKHIVANLKEKRKERFHWSYWHSLSLK